MTSVQEEDRKCKIQQVVSTSSSKINKWNLDHHISSSGMLSQVMPSSFYQVVSIGGDHKWSSTLSDVQMKTRLSSPTSFKFLSSGVHKKYKIQSDVNLSTP